MEGKAKERLGKADTALSEHFTSAVGVKGQRYEPAVTGGDRAPEEAVMSPRNLHQLAQHALVESMLVQMSTETRSLLSLVYAHGTDALWEETEQVEATPEKLTGLVTGKNDTPDPLGLLRLALAPSWGHGSYLRIAVTCERAHRAFAKRYPDAAPSASAVLDFLAFEAGRGAESAGMLAKMRDDCESIRDQALLEFDGVRVETLKRAKAEREAAHMPEQSRAERITEKAKIKAPVPACLQMTDDERKRYHAAALVFLASQEGA